MKRVYFYGVGIGLVLVCFGVVFYLYWKQTNENPFTFIYDDIVNSVSLNKVEEKYIAKNNKVVESDILVLQESKVPTVLLMGSLVDYSLGNNPQTGEKELFVKVMVEGKVVPFRVDNFATSGKDPWIEYVVREMNEEQGQIMTASLEESKTRSSKISENYVVLSSIDSVSQKNECEADHQQEVKDEWCRFDAQKKSYTRTQLLDNLMEFIKNTGRDEGMSLDFGEYLKLDGNFSVSLQINYVYSRVNDNK